MASRFKSVIGLLYVPGPVLSMLMPRLVMAEEYVYNTGDGCILFKLYAELPQKGPMNGPIVANITTTIAGNNGTTWSSNSTVSHWSYSNDWSSKNQAQLFG